MENYYEWDEYSYDAWEVFREPLFLYGCETVIADVFLKEMKIDIDQKELISFRAAPVHFAYLIVNFMRQLQSEHPEIFAKNFCERMDTYFEEEE